MSTGLCSESPNLEAGPGLELQGHKCRQVSRVKGTTPLQVASIFFFLHGNKEARSSVEWERCYTFKEKDDGTKELSRRVVTH